MNIQTVTYLAISLCDLDAKAGQQAKEQSKRVLPRRHVLRQGSDGVTRKFFGGPELMSDAIERFWSLVTIGKPDECWLFSKPHRKGYGKFSTSNKAYRAHRFAWQTVFGPPPSHLNICHECDTRLCCNPRHLFLAKSKLNTYDAWRKGRLHGRNCKAEISPELVTELRAKIATGLSQREVGLMHGLEQSTVSRIVRGLQKRCVEPLKV